MKFADEEEFRRHFLQALVWSGEVFMPVHFARIILSADLVWISDLSHRNESDLGLIKHKYVEAFSQADWRDLLRCGSTWLFARTCVAETAAAIRRGSPLYQR